MYHANFCTKMIIFNIFNQLKHIPLKALVAQWVHPLIYLRLSHIAEVRVRSTFSTVYVS